MDKCGRCRLWKIKIRDAWVKFRRRFFLTEYDLINFIRLFEEFKEETRSSVRLLQIDSITRSEFDQKLSKINTATRILKGNQTKQKITLTHVRDYLDNVEKIAEVNKKDAIGINKKLVLVDSMQKELNRNNAGIVARMQSIEKDKVTRDEITTLKNAYERAVNLEHSMVELKKMQDNFMEMSGRTLLRAKEELQHQIHQIHDTHEKFSRAIEIQATSNVTALRTLIKEFEKKYGVTINEGRLVGGLG